MCGWMEIISLTLQGVVLPSWRWLLGNSIFSLLRVFLWVGNWVTPTYYYHVCCIFNSNKQCPSSCWWLIYTSWIGRAPASPPPGRQELSGVLNQFVQQSPYAVVLLRGASYGFVAHGADAAHLKPLYQTPVKKKMGINSKAKLMFKTFHRSKLKLNLWPTCSGKKYWYILLKVATPHFEIPSKSHAFTILLK